LRGYGSGQYFFDSFVKLSDVERFG
jgi:hypothetical protein